MKLKLWVAVLALFAPVLAGAHDPVISAALEEMLVNPSHTAQVGGCLNWGDASTWGGAPPAPAGPTLTPSAGTAPLGGAVQVTVAGGPGNLTDWVGLYLLGTPDSAFLSWKYLSDSTSPPSAPLTGATLNFTMPTTAGTYGFRFFSSNGFTRLALSPLVVVGGGGTGPSVTPSAFLVAPGGAVQVAIAGGPANILDWVGLFPVGGANGSYLTWKYLSNTQSPPSSGQASVTLDFTMPQGEGIYEFRFFSNNGFTLLGASLPVTVGEASGPGVPGDGDTVLIPDGACVNFNGDTARIKWIKVQGHLGVTAAPMTINVETLVVDHDAELFLGTETARVVSPLVVNFLDSGAINTGWDTVMVSRGLISMGNLKLYGTQVTPFAFTDNASMGATSLTLNSPVVGWLPGHRLVLPGISPDVVQDDEATIASVSPDGLQVTLTTPLAFAHLSVPGRPMPVGNLNRMITLKSESTASPSVRAHSMLMHNVAVSYAAFKGMGRTNKAQMVTDLPNLGNLRGRYSLHIHKIGVQQGVNPVALVEGAVVEDDPGWAFVNHSSQANITDSIAYKVLGSGFTAEVGDEIGSFRRNLAIRMTGNGPSSPVQSDRGMADFAFDGYGYWAHSGGVVMEDNISAGTHAAGYVFMGTLFILPGGTATPFPIANLSNPTWVPPGGGTTIPPNFAPATFRRNVSFGTSFGLVLWDMGGNGTARSALPGVGLFEDSFIEAYNPVFLGYSSWQTMRGLTLRAADVSWSGMGISNTGVNSGFIYENNDIRGFSTGILDPTTYENTIAGNTIQALTGVFLMNTYQPGGRTVTISGNQFLDVPAEGLALASSNSWTYYPLPFQRFQDKQQKDVIAMFDMVNNTLYQPFASPYWTWLFAAPNSSDQPNDFLFVDGKKLFLAEYNPNFDTTYMLALPTQLRFKPSGAARTMGEVQSEFGLYLGNSLMPPDAAQSNSRILGMLADNPRTILPTITVNQTGEFYQLTNLTSGFMLRVKDAAGAFHDFGPFALTPGWNFPRITIDGYDRGIPVYCDPASTPPSPW